ncbi:hypothetical protein HNY73_021901 [Argiope bruennichi]|uniref:Uncharacterized protein n=1 Tax=Argiope bruennichi TaxID=94029 RepID=A0A8T0E059_ARGBR|nr:hypothetical protein HNY73_021901 [Argiope bruennichi]
MVSHFSGNLRKETDCRNFFIPQGVFLAMKESQGFATEQDSPPGPFFSQNGFLTKRQERRFNCSPKRFGVSVETDLTEPKIKDLILKSEDYDEEDAKVMLNSIIEDRLLAEVEKQNQREERLRKEEREHELQKWRIRAQRNVGHENSTDISITNKASQEMFHRFNMKDDISLNLTLFEHHANLTLLPKAQWFDRVEFNVNFECQYVNNDEVIVLSGLAEL